MGDSFARAVTDGPLLLAVGAALLAGLVSFLSPCVLPLVPGYLAYVTGLAGADLDAALGTTPTGGTGPAGAGDPGGTGLPARAAEQAVDGGPGGAATQAQQRGAVAVAGPADSGRSLPAAPPHGRGRVLAGTALFVLGFTVMFTLIAALLSRIQILVGGHQRTVDVVVGLLIIGFGLTFIGLVPGLQQQWRISRLPAAGLLGAPVLGAFFAISWQPCIGPTLGAVLGLALRAGQTDRAVVLAVAYSLGVGIPFIVFGVFFRRLLGVFRLIRRNSRWVTRFGGALLIIVGLTLVTGGWNDFLIWLQTTFSGAETLL